MEELVSDENSSSWTMKIAINGVNCMCVCVSGYKQIISATGNSEANKMKWNEMRSVRWWTWNAYEQKNGKQRIYARHFNTTAYGVRMLKHAHGHVCTAIKPNT